MQILNLSLFFSIAFFLSWVPISLFAHARGDISLKESPLQDIYLVAISVLLLAFLLVPEEARSSANLFAEHKGEFLQMGVAGALFSAFCVLRRLKPARPRIGVASKV